MAPRKAGTALTLARANLLDNQPEHLQQGMSEFFDVLRTTADDFNRGLAASVADVNLSPVGRANARREVAAKAHAKLNAIEATTIKNLSDRAATLERAALAKVTLAPPKDPADRLAFELTMREIRDQLRGLSATERAQVYLTTSDPMTLAAMDTAPMTLTPARPDGSRRLEPFVDPETRAAGLVARAEQADPENARLLGEVRALREAYVLALGTVRREMLDEVPAGAAVAEPVGSRDA